MAGKKKVLLKVIILGDSGVGKTTILQQYVNNTFIHEHKATIGADFMTKEIAVKDKLITLQIWDTAGQERFQSLGTAFYRGADACVLVYDVTSQTSFANMRTWRQDFLQQSSPENPDTFPFVVLANKTDLGGRQVDERAGQEFADEFGMLFFETSAKTGTNVKPGIETIADKASDFSTVPAFQEVVDASFNLTDKVPEAAPAGGGGDAGAGDSPEAPAAQQPCAC